MDKEDVSKLMKRVEDMGCELKITRSASWQGILSDEPFGWKKVHWDLEMVRRSVGISVRYWPTICKFEKCISLDAALKCLEIEIRIQDSKKQSAALER